MDDDIWEMLFIIFADWRVLLFVFAILLVLSLTGVIPWGDWV
jgi:hypothetical protein